MLAELMLTALSLVPFQSHPDTLQVPHCPDLGIIRVEYQPLRCGQPVEIRAVVGNIGGAASDSSTVAFFFPHIQLTIESRIGSVSAGDEVITDWVSATLSPGDHLLIVCADFYSEIDEIDDTNNCTFYMGLNATHYDIRYGLNPDASWEEMTLVAGPPYPSDPGTPENFVVENLQPGTRYYFKIKVGNHNLWSEESNIATEETLP